LGELQQQILAVIEEVATADSGNYWGSYNSRFWQLLRKLQQQILATIEKVATSDSGNY
jgi:hypothetical protein